MCTCIWECASAFEKAIDVCMFVGACACVPAQNAVSCYIKDMHVLFEHVCVWCEYVCVCVCVCGVCGIHVCVCVCVCV